MAAYKSFAEALSSDRSQKAASPEPVAANDNRPQRKRPEHRYRGTLPALRWLYENRPDLAEPMAEAVKSLAKTVWNSDAVDGDLEIRPTVGEIVDAASDGKNENGNPVWRTPKIERDSEGNASIRMGALRFKSGELVEYGRTKKGRKLEPRERLTARSDAPGSKRNPHDYVFGIRGAVASPLHAESHQRSISAEPALSPMYDPQRGVEAARAELVAHGVDGSVPFDELPFPAKRYPDAIAEGAEFLGGVVQSSGNSSSGALMWEAPEEVKGEARKIIEEVAAGSTLKEIGERMGYSGGKYAIEIGKGALVDAAKAMVAANDNVRKKKRNAA